MNKVNIEKIKDHIKNIPTFNHKDPEKDRKYREANRLMEGILNKIVSWYNELLELLEMENPYES